MSLKTIITCIILMQLVSAGGLNAQEITSKQVDSIVSILGKELTDHYPFPAISGKYAKALNANKKNYVNMNGDALAVLLTNDLQAVHKDVHLHIYKQNPLSASIVSALTEDEELQKNNYGFKSVELIIPPLLHM